MNENSEIPAGQSTFDRLMRGLIAVPKAELEAEERKHEKAKKARAKRIAKARKKK